MIMDSESSCIIFLKMRCLDVLKEHNNGTITLKNLISNVPILRFIESVLYDSYVGVFPF